MPGTHSSEERSQKGESPSATNGDDVVAFYDLKYTIGYRDLVSGWMPVDSVYRAERFHARRKKPDKGMMYFAHISLDGPVKYRRPPGSIGFPIRPTTRRRLA